jgi:hypothetical protein
LHTTEVSVPETRSASTVVFPSEKRHEVLLKKPEPNTVTRPPDEGSDDGSIAVTEGGVYRSTDKAPLETPATARAIDTDPARCEDDFVRRITGDGITQFTAVEDPTTPLTVVDAPTTQAYDAAAVNPSPRIVMVVPPATGTSAGARDAAVKNAKVLGAGKRSAKLVLPLKVIERVTAPRPDGAVHVIWSPATFAVVMVASKRHCGSDTVAGRPVPAIVTTVPPTEGPAKGETEVSDGTAKEIRAVPALVAYPDCGSVVIAMSWVPALMGGVSHVTRTVSMYEDAATATVPKRHRIRGSASSEKPVPVTVTRDPPAADTSEGSIAVSSK